MKTTFLVYEVTDKKKFKLYLIGEFPARTYARNEILRYHGQNKRFIIVKAIGC